MPLDMHDKHQDLPAPPDGGFRADGAVIEKVGSALDGLWRVKVVLWEDGQMQKINGFDIEPPPDPGEKPEDAELDNIVQRIYQCAHRCSEREGRKVICKALFYQREHDGDELKEVNPSTQIQFRVLSPNVGDEEEETEVLGDSFASVADVIGAVTPMMDAVVAPMIKSVAEDRKFVHDLIQGLQSQQGDLNTLLLTELSRGYENQQKTSRAIIGARESELESRRIATDMFTQGIKMQGEIMKERHEMVQTAHEAEVTRLKEEKRHAERMDMLKEFGPAIVPFLGGIMENVTAAFARGRQQARGETPTARAAPAAPQPTPAPPPWPPPSGSPGPATTVPPAPPTPPAAPPADPTATPESFQAALHPNAAMLRRFGELMSAETWEVMAKEFSGDQISLLRQLCAIESDSMVSGAFVQFYQTFSREKTERLGQYVTEEQGDLFMRAAEFAKNTIQSAHGTAPPPPQAPAQVIDMSTRTPQPSAPEVVIPEQNTAPLEEEEPADETDPAEETAETEPKPEVLDEAPSVTRRRKRSSKKKATKKTTKK